MMQRDLSHELKGRFSTLTSALYRQGLSLIKDLRQMEPGTGNELAPLCDSLLSRKGEGSGIALARHILSIYETLSSEEKAGFFALLVDKYGPDAKRLSCAIQQYTRSPAAYGHELHAASEPRRQELLRRLNLAPKGTERLIAMRHDALALANRIPHFEALDASFMALFSSWFNRGFLELKEVCWSSPATLLQKIIEYEAVHEIKGWADLRRRIEPADRRCFAYFHPQLPDNPLVYVEIALTDEMPASIQSLLTADRKIIDPKNARTVVFYSISNCHDGLRGVFFGNFLIKHAVELLKAELPSLDTFTTLSPIPGFRRWIESERRRGDSEFIGKEELAALKVLDEAGEAEHESLFLTFQSTLVGLAARYLLYAKNDAGDPVDSVARFHLRNGARIERLNWLADTSPSGFKQSYGLMVNYLYNRKVMEKNHTSFVEDKIIASSRKVQRLGKS